MASGIGNTAPGRLAADAGWTSAGGFEIGNWSGGGGKVAPGREAAFAG